MNNNRCKMCGGRVHMDGRAIVCDNCGHVEFIQPNQPQGQNYGQNQYGYYQPPKKNKAKPVVIIVAIFAIVIALAVAITIISMVGIINNASNDEYSSKIDDAVNDSLGDAEDIDAMMSTCKYIKEYGGVNAFKGTIVEEVCENVFGASLYTVTDQQMESIVGMYLEKDSYGYVLYYYLEDAEDEDFFYTDQYEIVGDQFRVFPNLYGVGVTDVDTVEEIKAFSDMTYLTQLYIYDSPQLEDFSYLPNFTELEDLVIDTEYLYDIDFVDNMPNLSCFGLSGTEVKDLSPIEKYMGQMEYLYLTDNKNISDYSFVKNASKLKSLSLGKRYDTDNFQNKVPDLSAMADLETLQLSGYDDFASLEKLDKVTKLSIYNTDYTDNLDFINEMDSLSELDLQDISLDYKGAKAIAKSKHINKLWLDDAFIWCDISIILNNKNISSINLEDATFGIRFDKLKDNGNLESLNLNGVRMVDTEKEGKAIPFYETNYENREHTDMFEHYPNIKILYVADWDISDVKFASKLTRLERLDISDNHITDLSPIRDLPLQFINCEGLTLTETANLDDAIYDGR